MGHEMNIQQVTVAQFGWVKAHANGFRMTRLAAAHLLVSRVWWAAGGVDTLNRFDTNHVFKNGFGTPETPTTEDGIFDCHTDSFTLGNDLLCHKTSRSAFTKE